MTVRECLFSAKERLAAAGVPDAGLDAEYLLAHVLQKTRMELFLYGSDTLSQEQERQFAALLLCREKRMPLQYLLRSQNFYGLELEVDSRVLIPRAETECLCEIALEALKGKVHPRVLDLCTGSGAIALAMRHERPDAEVYASDLSEDALSLARSNAKRLNLPVNFAQGDLFTPWVGQRFDMILSNPPYIPEKDYLTLQEEVLQEPRMALDGGADGLDFYRRIAKEAPKHLKAGGFLMVECGNTQTEAVAELFRQNRLEGICVLMDCYQNPRVVRGQLGGKT